VELCPCLRGMVISLCEPRTRMLWPAVPFHCRVPGMSKLGDIAERLRTELRVYRCIARHPDTPRSARFLLGLALGYLCLPFDLIPDWLPVIGHMDDLLIVPFLVWLALRLIPRHVVLSCRDRLFPPE